MRKLFFGLAGWAALIGSPALAEAPTSSLRPVARVDISEVKLASATFLPSSKRPVVRPGLQRISVGDTKQISEVRFQGWIKRFKNRAKRNGISQATLDRAFKGVTYNAYVIDKDRNQNEFTKTVWEYLDSAASETRIKNGKAALRDHRQKLDAIERKYGVEKEVVVAVWGLESAYGTFKGDIPVIEALATLAFDGRRGKFFEAQLLAALEILQDGHTSPANMKGSWAGAMGHTQFIPTSFQSFAVDFTGDGRRDIWSDDPSDALASTAAYLKRSGWTKGQPWGVEVKLPTSFDYKLANRKITKAPSEWARLGVVGLDGKPVRNFGEAAVLLPGGHQGVALLVFDNFAAIEKYNTADAYVIGVGHLSDRITGGGAFKSGWPYGDRALTFDERKELQRRLNQRGHGNLKVDGLIGPITIDAVRSYQLGRGFVPDGYASFNLLKGMR
ncbi:lytic murein transglycosylase [Cognatishimia sp. D5M38]|uniref:Lytic murein transglycosylase n=1 Tax=Cognatishimia coralii TaxID=3083254 RepID=A0ABU8QHB6_9RHOB